MEKLKFKESSNHTHKDKNHGKVKDLKLSYTGSAKIYLKPNLFLRHINLKQKSNSILLHS